jgi:hypothetical protein
LNARIAAALALPAPRPPAPSRAAAAAAAEAAAPPPPAAAEDDASQTFEFRLFSHSAPEQITIAPRKLGPGGFLAPRPLSHYLAPRATALERQQFAAAATTAAEVLARSREPWPGRTEPWRVAQGARISITLKRGSDGKAKGGARGDDDAAVGKDRSKKVKHKRPGKKNRIARRKADRKVEAEKKEREEKDERAADKRKRLNKIKNQRKRAKKRGGKGGETGDKGEGETMDVGE